MKGFRLIFLMLLAASLLPLACNRKQADVPDAGELLSHIRYLDSLVQSELVDSIDRINNGQIEKNATPEIVKESPTTAVIDGHHGIGMVIGYHSMNLAIKKAKELGAEEYFIKANISIQELVDKVKSYLK